MQESVERFLVVLETERGFSLNTIAAYRNDLTQFVGHVGVMSEADHLPPVVRWADLTAGHLTGYLLHLRGRDYASSTVAR